MNYHRNAWLTGIFLALGLLGGCNHATQSEPVPVKVNAQEAEGVAIFQYEQKTFTVIGNYTDYKWYVNGVFKSSSSVYTFNAGSWPSGDVCEITVTVIDRATGERRSGTIRVEVP